MLSLAGCHNRQQRLLKELERNECDLFLTADYRTVYYLSGALSGAEWPTILALWRDGHSGLITSAKSEAAADERIPLEVYSLQRAVTRPVHNAARLLKDLLNSRATPARCAVERSSFPGLFEPACELLDATGIILALRKKKEDDEIAEIRESLGYCAAAYAAAKQTIAPGLTEIDVYDAMHAAVVREAGTSVEFPGDFACGARSIRGGGPPTRREIQAGDLYVLDIFPAPALYFGDTCRTFAVGTPTDVQQRAWEAVREAQRLGEKAVRPGVRAADVYREVKDFLDAQPFLEKSFFHHAGHGIGHRGHEAPYIIPGSEDIFEVGDVITLEPGVYTEAMQGGLRLEDNYVVREDGLENLFDFPLDL